MPIDENGVFKFYYNNGQLGPFALGYIPVRRYDSSSNDFDFSVNIPEKLIELEPNQVIPISRNKRQKTFALYDDEADSDMDIEETNDQPLQQQQRTLLKLRDANSNNNNDTSYRNIGTFTINVDIPIYDGYDQSNPYSITQNGSGVISIPQNYEGLGEINYNVNVPQTLVNNTDVNSSNEIIQNGTFSIPTGYTGFNGFTVNVPTYTKPIAVYYRGANYQGTSFTSYHNISNLNRSTNWSFYAGDLSFFLSLNNSGTIQMTKEQSTQSTTFGYYVLWGNLSTGNLGITCRKIYFYDSNKNYICDFRMDTYRDGTYIASGMNKLFDLPVYNNEWKTN